MHSAPGSVTEAGLCRELVETCVARFGGIDVMVNNADITRDRTMMKMSDEDFDEVIGNRSVVPVRGGSQGLPNGD